MQKKLDFERLQKHLVPYQQISKNNFNKKLFTVMTDVKRKSNKLSYEDLTYILPKNQEDKNTTGQKIGNQMLDDFFDELAGNYEEKNHDVDVRNHDSYIKQLEQKNEELRKVDTHLRSKSNYLWM